MARLLVFTPNAWADYTYWQTQDEKTLKRINTLIESTSREPFAGLGKPEALHGELSGYWSKRIDDVNRLIYQVTDDKLNIFACRYHCNDK